MNDNDSNSDYRVYYTPNSIFTLYSHKVSIIVANVYVNNLEEWLLRGSLLPCYKKLKNSKFSKRLEKFHC